MKKLQTALAVAAALLGTSFAAWGQPVTAREQITNAIQQGCVSFAHKDLAACMKHYAADYQGQGISGPPYNRQQAKHNIAYAMTIMQSGHIQPYVESIVPVAGGMSVVSSEHTVLHIMGRRIHKLHVLVIDARSRDMWVPTKAGWRLRRGTQLSMAATIDGKVQSVKLHIAGSASPPRASDGAY